MDRGRRLHGNARQKAAAGSRTQDNWITAYADGDGRIVVTKDFDFVDSHQLYGRRRKLLLISIGNISNSDLASLLVPLLPAIVAEFATHDFIEVDDRGLTIHG